MNAIRF